MKRAETTVTDEMLVAAMRAFEAIVPGRFRYLEKDKWHVCDLMAMRAAISAALVAKSGVATGKARP